MTTVTSPAPAQTSPNVIATCNRTGDFYFTLAMLSGAPADVAEDFRQEAYRNCVAYYETLAD